MSGIVFKNKIEGEVGYEGFKAGGTKLPISVQSFEILRNDSFLYVDKTLYIYILVNSGRQFFLSRPRRFGKSLFVSTLAAFWEGKKELFHGLRIEQLTLENDKVWEKCPVLYFDLNKDDYNREHALEDVLDEHLRKWEKEYDCALPSASLPERFRNTIESAFEKTGKKVVVLVDEYDKPLLDVFGNDDRQEHNKQVFKGFFSTLKSYDSYLQFVFITGVTRFSKVSIFSDLNQLNDISMEREYAEICGITESEIDEYFLPMIGELAGFQELDISDCRAKLKKMYDGYCFSVSANGVYNPYSIMNVFNTKEFSEYWFSTGAPTFLVEMLKKNSYDIKKFTSKDFFIPPRGLSDYIQGSKDPLPLLYQAGYLTIKEYDREYEMCRLGYPNDEVKYAFLDTLMPLYLNNDEPMSPLDIRGFSMDIENGNHESLKNRFIMLLAHVPYPSDKKIIEWNYQIVIYLVFTMLGKFSRTEVHTNIGRIDCTVEAKNYIYIFEFKVDGAEEEAMTQIKDRCYPDYFKADPRKKYAVGVNFDSKSRNIRDWKVEVVE